MKMKKTIAIIGNPNCGKTTLFNELTGGRQHVGNWPGVTVEKKEGSYVFADMTVTVIDLPGIYSLSSTSLDEEVARDFLLYENPDLVINIVDATHLERNLYLTIQLMEMRVPMVIVLNMMDRVRQKRMRINEGALAQMTGCPVVSAVASKEIGIEAVKNVIQRALVDAPLPSVQVTYPQEVENAIRYIMQELPRATAIACDKRWLSVAVLEQHMPERFLSGDDRKRLSAEVAAAQMKILGIIGEDIGMAITDSRYGVINALCKKAVDRSDVIRHSVSDAIDRIVLNSYIGLPLFLCAMYLMFWTTINLAGCFIDFFDLFSGAVCVDGVHTVLNAVSVAVPEFFHTLIADGIGGGIQTVATFIPPIAAMFLCLAFLEDSGYMARAAFLMDRWMRIIGLPGKAFVPMLVGFGCNVPAIMAARTLENRKDRIMTIMMNPFMSCGARMPVYAMFAAAFFPRTGGIVVFALYLTGIAAAILTAGILKYAVFHGEPSSFIMELPPYHMPTLKGVVIHTWHRLHAFMLKAGKAILVVVVLLTCLQAFTVRSADTAAIDGREPLLQVIGKSVAPVFAPMGMRSENWPAAVGIFTGIFAKEAVLGTMNTVYPTIDANGVFSEEDDASGSFGEKIREAWATVPQNLSQLSLPFVFSANEPAVSKESAEDDRLKRSLLRHFDGAAGAFAYLLLVLLYMPCVAAIAAVYAELGWRWTVFSVLYMSGLAWMAATVFYQCARFTTRPVQSGFWIAGCCAAVIIFAGLLALRRRGKQMRGE